AGHHGDFRAVGGDRGGGQCLGEGAEAFGGSGDLEHVIALGDVVGTGFEGDLHQLFFVDARLRDRDQPLLLEHPGDAAAGPHVTTVFFEHAADFGDRSVAVVGDRVGEHGDPAGAVPLVGDLFVAH